MKETPVNKQLLSVLELDKILDAAARLAVSDRTACEIRAMRPSGDLNEIRTSLRETAEMSDAIRFDEPVPIHGIRDHAAIKFGKLDTVLHITAFPTTFEGVSFPSD